MTTEKDNRGTAVGVGCFAARETLGRVLRRAVESYILGNWDDLKSAGVPATEGALLLSRLMAKEDPQEPGRPPERVAGFHLVYRNRSLSLSVFTSRSGAAPRTFSLDELTRVREKRLH